MTAETLTTLKKDETGKIIVLFTTAHELTVSKPSKTPFAAWALVESDSKLIILKESPSTSLHYSKQDIGFALHSPKFSQHYDISTKQYNDLFGEGSWTKTWLENESFNKCLEGKELTMDEDALSRQEESWKSTGHR